MEKLSCARPKLKTHRATNHCFCRREIDYPESRLERFDLLRLRQPHYELRLAWLALKCDLAAKLAYDDTMRDIQPQPRA